MYYKLLLLVLSVVISGCSSLNQPKEWYHTQNVHQAMAGQAALKDIVSIKVESAGKLEFKCSGCTIAVSDPNIATRLPKPVRGNNAADVAMHWGSELFGFGKWGTVGYGFGKLVEEFGTRTFNTTNHGDGKLIFQQDYNDIELDTDNLSADGSMDTINTTTSTTTTEGSNNSTVDRHDINDSYNPDSHDQTQTIQDSMNPEWNDDNSTRLSDAPEE